ncbi:hypothetical protein GGP41_006713 [Bipolaris sorokiniana]|uniref:Uncharacterized protein n=1 Tax=Cochliobolus sativus TaxID=45130 RepID=A0A8H5ZU55_COCSA|nr:hypothetical protein GGP41_006713 [Bipolaris sorokiniana]
MGRDDKLSYSPLYLHTLLLRHMCWLVVVVMTKLESEIRSFGDEKYLESWRFWNLELMDRVVGTHVEVGTLRTHRRCAFVEMGYWTIRLLVLQIVSQWDVYVVYSGVKGPTRARVLYWDVENYTGYSHQVPCRELGIGALAQFQDFSTLPMVLFLGGSVSVTVGPAGAGGTVCQPCPDMRRCEVLASSPSSSPLVLSVGHPVATSKYHKCNKSAPARQSVSKYEDQSNTGVYVYAAPSTSHTSVSRRSVMMS